MKNLISIDLFSSVIDCFQYTPPSLATMDEVKSQAFIDITREES